MSELTKDQHEMLVHYDQLLSTISEALDYLEKNISGDAPPQAQQVFEDLLLALEQVSHSHDQMLVLFDGEEEVKLLMNDFFDIVKLLQQWFTLESNEEKQQLLAGQVVPAYEAWRSRIQLFVKPYIVH